MKVLIVLHIKVVGDDGESTYLYLITNDIDLSFDEVLEIYKRRWKIEEYHKSLKQNLKIEHFPPPQKLKPPRETIYT